MSRRERAAILIRRRTILAVGSIMIGLMALACDSPEPIPAPRPAIATPTKAVEQPVTSPSPTQTQEPSGTVTPESGTSTPTPSVEQPSATPTSAPPTPTPTPTPVPPPAGYLAGKEHGIALVQTTRAPSTTREGWLDITLDLAVTKFGPDAEVASAISVQAEPKSVCFETQGVQNDCLLVAWGSEEQFEAELRPSQKTGQVDWPSRKAWPYSVTFEVASNATKASLFFGDHKVSLDLQGDARPNLPAREPTSAPVPAPEPGAPPGTAGYYLGTEYGIAVVGASRQPNAEMPTWADVSLDLAVMTFREESALAVPIKIATSPESMSFIGSSVEDRVQVVWGADSQFDAVARISPEGEEFPWPRGKGMPVRLSFTVPENLEQATLAFGDHRIGVDTVGMTGEVPNWDYRLRYPEIKVGETLYDFNNKTITLAAVEDNGEIGDIHLKFSAKNNSEANDFTPLVWVDASRVSRNGLIFDDEDATAGWMPATTRVQGAKLAPGQLGEFGLVLPRVSGANFKLVDFGNDRPDGVVFQLTATDAATETGTKAASSAYKVFERSDKKEVAFWVAAGASIGGANLAGFDLRGVDFSGFDLSKVDLTNADLSRSTLVQTNFSGSKLSGAILSGANLQNSNFSEAVLIKADLSAADLSMATLSGADLSGVDFTNANLMKANLAQTNMSDAILVNAELSSADLHASNLENANLQNANLDGTIIEDANLRGANIYQSNLFGPYLLWKGSSHGKNRPVIADGIVYGKAFALRAASGEVIWDRSEEFWERDGGLSSPAVAAGLMFFCKYGVIYALDASTGETLWSDDIGAPFPNVKSSPAYSEGTVYIGQDMGDLVAFQAKTGLVRWRFETRGDVDSSPAVVGGIVYVGSQDNHLYAIDAKTGELIWRYQMGSDVDSSPTVVEGVVYVGSDDGYLYAVGAETGELVWRFKTGGYVRSSPAVAGGVVYVGSWDGFLYAIDAATGELNWRYRFRDVGMGLLSTSPVVVEGVLYVDPYSDPMHAFLVGPPS